MSYCIGIDLGTSAIKMTMVDEKGKVIKSVSEEYPLILSEEGYSEQNPSLWVDALKAGIKKITSTYSDIKGLVIDGQMHGLVALDSDYNVIRNCILWNDTRSKKQCDELNQNKEFLLSETGNIAFPGFTLPKILWMKENENELFSKIKHVLLPKDYLNFILTGNLYTDYSDAAGTLALNVKNRCWSKNMIALTGLTLDCFPTIVETGTNIGVMKEDIKKELGFKNDVYIYQGAADNAAAAISNGVIDDNECSLSLGTSGTIYISSKKYSYCPNGAIHSFLSGNNSYCLLACMLSAASCLKWFNDSILENDDYAKYQNKIESKNLGESSLFFLPYLMGERSPINDSDAKGAFIGLKMSTTKEDMTQAILEGVAFAFKDSLETIKNMGIVVNKAYLTGGGSKSILWQKILSSILNIPLYILSSSYGPSYGMAITGLVSMNKFSSLEEFKRNNLQINKIVYPNDELIEKYNKKYQHFKKLYPALKGLF